MHEELMEQVVGSQHAEIALRAVVRHGGAAGIDGLTTGQLREHLRQHWTVLRDKLLDGTYVPSPVRRAEIRKPNGGTRRLGIPTVQDRFVEHLLVQALTPIFDPWFSPSSHGFRPGRSAHDAVKAAQRHAREGRTWVVDLDIRQFFDHVNHDILMHRIGQTIRDPRVLRLIGRYLRSGVLLDGVKCRTPEGTPQGGPLSPLLANIDLDALAKELEARGHAFSRYADDCNIYVGSQPAARRVLENVTAWLRRELRLEVNAEKSGTGQVWERKFLGFQLTRELTRGIAPRSLERFKDKVRELWRSCQSVSSGELRAHWCAYLRGWWGYFHLAEQRQPLWALEGWIRRHIRACFWQRWPNAAGRLRVLRRLGLRPRACAVARSSQGAWPLAKCWSLQHALSNAVVRSYGFLMPSDLAALTSC
jgi:group II intron reverse transcriptase/maturase